MSIQDKIDGEAADEAGASRKLRPDVRQPLEPSADISGRRDESRFQPPRRPLGAQPRSADLPAEMPELPATRPPPTNRRPFGSIEQKMAYGERPGFRRHWFNDRPGWIQRAIDAGYTHVHDSRGRPVSIVVGRDEAGAGLIAYLMELPRMLYEEDVAREHELVERKMSAIKRGAGNSLENSYVPDQGIKLQR